MESGNETHAEGKSGFFRRLHKLELSPKQREIANYLSRNYRTAVSQTAAELAAAMGVSEATVIRLAQELGYDGFRGLKRQLHVMLREDLTSLELLARERARKGGGSDTLAEEVERETLHLRSLAADIARGDFDRLVKGLVDASRVYIMGHRASASLAQFFGYTLAKVHPDVITLDGAENAAYDRFRTVPPGSWMVAIGFARYPRETVELMEFARDQRITVAAITDRILSPVAQRADLILVTRAEPLSFVDSHCAPQALIAAILVEYGVMARERTETMLEKFERIVELKNLFYVGP